MAFSKKTRNLVKQPTELIVELNLSLRLIIVTLINTSRNQVTWNLNEILLWIIQKYNYIHSVSLVTLDTALGCNISTWPILPCHIDFIRIQKQVWTCCKQTNSDLFRFDPKFSAEQIRSEQSHSQSGFSTSWHQIKAIF